MRTPDLVLLLIALAGPAAADPLPGMAGSWTGSGWARQVPGGPQEALRCRIENAYEAERTRLRITGKCAVPGRQFAIDGALKSDPDGSVGGFWSNPDGPGQTAIAGQVRDDAVYFTFRATDPKSGRDVSQTVTWRLEGDSLSFRSVDRTDDSPMSEIAFTR